MMNNIKIGFIGGGAMAEALLRGMLAAGLVDGGQVTVADLSAERCAYLSNMHGVLVSQDASGVAAEADVLFLTVKPQVVQAVMAQIQDQLQANTLVISVVAALSLEELQAAFPVCPVIRVMPNTPVAVGAGMSALSIGRLVSKAQEKIAIDIFAAAGMAVVVGEELMDAVTGLSGSGPAYGFVMIDALADAGVLAGLSRQMAITLAAQTLLGAAKMVLETGEHPAKLRDMVTSPGGTTIAAVHVMEQRGVRAALIDAVLASADRSREMGKKTHE